MAKIKKKVKKYIKKNEPTYKGLDKEKKKLVKARFEERVECYRKDLEAAKKKKRRKRLFLLCFCIFSVRFIRSLCAYLCKKNGTLSFDDVCDICRMFSSEIEYSEENTAIAIDYFKFD